MRLFWILGAKLWSRSQLNHHSRATQIFFDRIPKSGAGPHFEFSKSLAGEIHFRLMGCPKEEQGSAFIMKSSNAAISGPRETR